MSRFEELRKQKEIINLRESARSSWREELSEKTDHPYVDVMPNEKTGEEKKGKKKEKVEEAYKSTPFEKMERQSGKAYQKEQDAVRKGDEKEANKQMKRRHAMKSPLSRRNELINQGKGPANEKTRRLKEELSLTPNTTFREGIEDAMAAVKKGLPKGALIDTKNQKKRQHWSKEHARKVSKKDPYEKKND